MYLSDKDFNIFSTLFPLLLSYYFSTVDHCLFCCLTNGEDRIEDRWKHEIICKENWQVQNGIV